MILTDLRSAIVAGIRAALPSLKDVSVHGGRFSLEELKAAATRSPAVRVACLGIPSVIPATDGVTAVTVWGAFAIAADQSGQRRDAAALGLVAGLAAMVPLNSWGLDDQVDGAADVRADNLFSREIDRQGVALWALTWKHAVDLVATDLDELDDFLLAYAQWDIDGDGETDATDEIDLPAAE